MNKRVSMIVSYGILQLKYHLTNEVKFVITEIDVSL